MKKILFVFLGIIFCLPVMVHAETVTNVSTASELVNCLSISENKTCVLSNDITLKYDDLSGYFARVNSVKKLNLNGNDIYLDDVRLLVLGTLNIVNEDETGSRLSDGTISGGHKELYENYKILINCYGNLNIYGGTYKDGAILYNYVKSYGRNTINIYYGIFYSDIICHDNYLNIYDGYFYGGIDLNLFNTNGINRYKFSGGYFESSTDKGNKMYNGGKYKKSELDTVQNSIIENEYEMTGSLNRGGSSEYIYFPNKFTVLKKITGSWDLMTATWDKISNATTYKISLFKDGNVLNNYNNIELDSKNTEYDFEDVILSNGTGDYKFSVTACNKDLCGTAYESLEIEFNIFNVDFKDINDNLIDSSSVLSGSKVLKVKDPSKTGYTFKGWYLDKNFTNVYDFDNTITSDLVLYAKFEINNYQVTYNSDGIDYYIEFVNYNSKATKPSDPSKTGYTFKGWYLDKNFTKSYDFDNVVTSDLVLYAKFEINKYQITYKVDDSNYKIESVNYNSKASKPTNPSKTGYTFKGWYLDKNFTKLYDFDEVVTSDLVLYAAWLTQITEANATITLPVGKAFPDINPVSGNSAMYSTGGMASLTDAQWSTDFTYFTEFNKNNAFVAGTDYTLYMAFRAKDGYCFTDETVFKINGNIATEFSTTGDSKFIRGEKYTFTAEDAPVTKIKEIRLTMNPIKSKNEISDTATIEIEPSSALKSNTVPITWKVSEDNLGTSSKIVTGKFEAGKYYLWTMDLDSILNDDYVLDESTKIYVNGIEQYPSTWIKETTILLTELRFIGPEIIDGYVMPSTVNVETEPVNIFDSNTVSVNWFKSDTGLDDFIYVLSGTPVTGKFEEGKYYIFNNSLPISFNSEFEIGNSFKYYYNGVEIASIVDNNFSFSWLKAKGLYSYKYILGDNQKLNTGKISSYSYKIDGDCDEFELLKIGELSLIKDTDYIVTKGSTIITFTDSGIAKLNLLTAGVYNVENIFTNNNVIGRLMIEDEVIQEEKIIVEENPNTSDGIISSIILGSISLIGLTCCIYINKKKKFS